MWLAARERTSARRATWIPAAAACRCLPIGSRPSALCIQQQTRQAMSKAPVCLQATCAQSFPPAAAAAAAVATVGGASHQQPLQQVDNVWLRQRARWHRRHCCTHQLQAAVPHCLWQLSKGSHRREHTATPAVTSRWRLPLLQQAVHCQQSRIAAAGGQRLQHRLYRLQRCPVLVSQAPAADGFSQRRQHHLQPLHIAAPRQPAERSAQHASLPAQHALHTVHVCRPGRQAVGG